MSLNFEIIGKRIKEIRLEKCLSQEKLAEMCNISVPHISRIESGKKHPSLECLVKLGDILGVTVNTFLYRIQKNDFAGYKSELLEILKDCDNYEKNVLLDITKAAKKTMRENNSLVRWTNF